MSFVICHTNRSSSLTKGVAVLPVNVRQSERHTDTLAILSSPDRSGTGFKIPEPIDQNP